MYNYIISRNGLKIQYQSGYIIFIRTLLPLPCLFPSFTEKMHCIRSSLPNLLNKVHKGHDGKCFKLVQEESNKKCNSL